MPENRERRLLENVTDTAKKVNTEPTIANITAAIDAITELKESDEFPYFTPELASELLRIYPLNEFIKQADYVNQQDDKVAFLKEYEGMMTNDEQLLFITNDTFFRDYYLVMVKDTLEKQLAQKYLKDIDSREEKLINSYKGIYGEQLDTDALHKYFDKQRKEVVEKGVESTIDVLIKHPGELPEKATIPNTLEVLQRAVGGHIELVGVSDACLMICNGDGKLIGLPDNFGIATGNLVKDRLVGTVIFANNNVVSGALISLPEKETEALIKCFNKDKGFLDYVDFDKELGKMPENKIDALIEKCRGRVWREDLPEWKIGEFLTGATAAYLKEHGLESEFDAEEKMVDLLSQVDKEYLHSEPDCPPETNVEFAVQRCRERAIEQQQPKEQETKATIRDLFTDPKFADIDAEVYDDFIDGLFNHFSIAFVGNPDRSLTEEGKNYWKDVLDLPINVKGETIRIHIPDEDENEMGKLVDRAKRFLRAVAGYCSDKDYDKWFDDGKNHTEASPSARDAASKIVVKRNYAAPGTLTGKSDIKIYNLSDGCGSIMPRMLLHEILEQQLPLNNRADKNVEKSMEAMNFYGFSTCGAELRPQTLCLENMQLSDYDVFNTGNLNNLLTGDDFERSSGAMVVEATENEDGSVDVKSGFVLPSLDKNGETPLCLISVIEYMFNSGCDSREIGAVQSMFRVFNVDEITKREPVVENSQETPGIDTYNSPNIPYLSDDARQIINREVDRSYRIEDVNNELLCQTSGSPLFDENDLSTFDNSVLIGRSEFMRIFDPDAVAESFEHDYDWTLDGSCLMSDKVGEGIDEAIDYINNHRREYSPEYFDRARSAYKIIVKGLEKCGLSIDESGLGFGTGGTGVEFNSLEELINQTGAAIRHPLLSTVLSNEEAEELKDNVTALNNYAKDNNCGRSWYETMPEINRNPVILLKDREKVAVQEKDVER